MHTIKSIDTVEEHEMKDGQIGLVIHDHDHSADPIRCPNSLAGYHIIRAGKENTVCLENPDLNSEVMISSLDVVILPPNTVLKITIGKL